MSALSSLLAAKRPGAIDDAGHTIYSYAHPLFWAPYSVIGDGGGN
jgi:CHAT domain-containing protein